MAARASKAQELEGLIVDAEGALFSTEHFARTRAGAPAKFDRIVVAVDPPAGRNGAACGIVVAGSVIGSRLSVLGTESAAHPITDTRSPVTACILEDSSAHGLSPLGWAQRACEAARRWKADAIIAEANQGGEMVRTVLSQAFPPCPVKLVHASEGKRARAEPIALLYEQNRIFHCAPLAQLEEELMALGADESAEATDRADAAIWALSELMLTSRLEPRVRLL